MSDNASIPMEKAITVGLSEVTLARTLELFAAHLSSGSDRALNFRGDLAERYNYDKIKPAMKPAQSQGNVVFIEAVSQKNRRNSALPNSGQPVEAAGSAGTPELKRFR